jgi:hypothetical protein
MRTVPMETTAQLKAFLKDLFASQRLAVLATQSKKQPYGNLVAFVATEDLNHLLLIGDVGSKLH